MEWQNYLTMVDALGNFFGGTAEVILFEFSGNEQKAIYITNSLTQRGIGSSMSTPELAALRYLEAHDMESHKVFENGMEELPDFKSSISLIKDDGGEIIGAVVINLKQRELQLIRNFINNLASTDSSGIEGLMTDEYKLASGNLHHVISTNIQKYTSLNGTDVTRLKPDEKMEIVKELMDLGVFQIKNAINEVSAQLHTSTPTIYRYIARIQKEEDFTRL